MLRRDFFAGRNFFALKEDGQPEGLPEGVYIVTCGDGYRMKNRTAEGVDEEKLCRSAGHPAPSEAKKEYSEETLVKVVTEPKKEEPKKEGLGFWPKVALAVGAYYLFFKK